MRLWSASHTAGATHPPTHPTMGHYPTNALLKESYKSPLTTHHVERNQGGNSPGGEDTPTDSLISN